MAEQEVQAIFTADISGITSGAQSAIKSMQSVQSSTKSVSDSVSATTSTIGKAMVGVGTATTIMGVKALKGYGDFEASLNKAAVIAGGTSKDIQGLADVANKMGAELPLSAQDAADAMVAMARDGASIGTIKKEFPAIAEAATAAGADLQQTASVVQQSMNIWGDSLKSPARAAAILTQTANLSNASIEDMQQALATIGGTANNAGISMEDTSTAIGLLTNRGFSAAQASQDLNHALLLMQAPSKQAAAQAQALGINFNDAQGNMKPLPTILNEIADATANMSSSDKAAALKKMFGTSGMAAILPLMKSVKDNTDNATTSWSAFSSQMDQASSSTATATKFLQDQANEMQKNLGSKIEQVGGNWESLTNKAMAGSAGVTGAFLDMTNSALSWAGDSNSAFANVIRQFIGLSPAIGAGTVALGGFLVNIKNIKNGFADLGVTIKALFTTPLGLALVAVAAFSAAIAGAYKYSKPFRDAIASIANAFNQVFNPAISKSGSTVKKVGSTIGGVIQTISEAVGQKLANAINSINWVKVFTKINNVMTKLVHIAKQAVDVFELLAVKITNSGLASQAWDVFKSTLKVIYDLVKKLYHGLQDLYHWIGQIGGEGSKTGKTLQSAFAISSLFTIPIGLKLLPTLLGLILSPAKKLTGAFTGLLSSLNPFSSKIDSVSGSAKKTKKPFSDFALKTLEIGTGVGIAAAGLATFAFGISSLSSQGKQGTDTLKTFGVVVGLLAAEFALLGRDLTAGAVGIGVMLGGITAAALAFTALASTGENGRQTMVTFSVAVGALGVVFALLGPALTAGAVGIGVFGAAILAAGVGIGLASLGLAALITAINNTNISFTQIVTTMGAVGVGFATMITGFLVTLSNNMPVISQSLLNMLVQFLAQLVTYTPILTQQLINILLGFINVITANIVPIANAITSMLLAMMDAIAGNAPQLVAGFAAMLGQLAEALVQIMPYIIQLTGAIMAGMIAAVATYTTSFNQIGGVILNALIAGVTGKKYDAVGAATDIINSAAKSASDNGVAAFNAAGGNSAISALTAISRQKGGANSAGAGLGQSAADGVRSKSGEANSAGSHVANRVSDGVGSVSLNSQGEGIMGSFLGGLQGVNWGKVMGFVGSVAGWIAKHKGPISYDRKLLIPAGQAIMGGFNQSLQSSFEDVKDTVNGVAPYIQNALSGSSDYMINTRLADNMQLSDGTLSVDMNKNAQPAQINLNMGGSQWNAYVGDISNTQGNNAQLKKNNSVYL